MKSRTSGDRERPLAVMNQAGPPEEFARRLTSSLQLFECERSIDGPLDIQPEELEPLFSLSVPPNGLM